MELFLSISIFLLQCLLSLKLIMSHDCGVLPILFPLNAPSGGVFCFSWIDVTVGACLLP